MTNHETKLLELCKKYDIIDNLELAHLFAQCAHESLNFTRFVENLNYSADALVALFSKYFTRETANIYGRTPAHSANQEAIANIIYANRMGNKFDDGYKYRARGCIGLTGRSNYIAFSQWLKFANTVVDNPDQVADTDLKYLTAIFFWQTNKLSQYALADNITAVTKKINGGLIGLEDRIKQLEKYKQVFR
jgi:putative chitinase